MLFWWFNVISTAKLCNWVFSPCPCIPWFTRILKISVDGKQISEGEKIQLFDLINKIIELPAERGDKIQEKMKQLIFVLKALKSQKSKILNGLDKRIKSNRDRPVSTR